MLNYDTASKAVIVDRLGALNHISIDLMRELNSYGAIEAHSVKIVCTHELNLCKLTLDDKFNYEIDTQDPISDGADVLIKQCHFPEDASRNIIHLAFTENDAIIFGKVLH